MEPRRTRVTYALWLMPEGDLFRRLAGTILELSRKHSTPAFEPHVTLLGGITGPEREVISKSAELVPRIRPFMVRLTHVDYLDEYFRCFFVRVAATGPAVKAHQVAKEVFGLRESAGYMPHLSLIYGHLASGMKERMVAELGRRFDLEFKVRSLHLFLTRGEPGAWRRVREFGLK
jgi:2'-5' RNA ligase